MYKICLIVAMEIEAKKLIEQLELQATTLPFDRDIIERAYHKKLSKADIYLVLSHQCHQHGVERIGTVGAALMTLEVSRVLNPTLIVNVGTAGGFSKKGAQIGDVYLSDGAIHYHDRLMTAPYNEYGIGSYPVADYSQLASQHHIKLGIVSTGNSLFPSENEMQQMLKNNADVKDMEAAAIAEVAYMKHIPCIALKVVTDLVDNGNDDQHHQFNSNYKIAMAQLTKKTAAFLSELVALKTS